MAVPIDAARREAWEAVRPEILRGVGQEYGAVQVFGFLSWRGKQWVTPFDQLSRARAYFDHADEIGIDYDYAALFDVSTPDHPFLAWEKLGGGWSTISGTSSVDATGASRLEKLRRLRELVTLHDEFWGRLLSEAPDDPRTAFWMAEHWGPWFERWSQAEQAGAMYDGDLEILSAFVDESAGSLSWLREVAAAKGIPIPDIGSGRLGFVSPGWDSQLDPRYQSSLRTSGDTIMPSIIGRRGGHGHAGHAGHGRGGRGRGRRQFFGGGGWWGWPYPYGYPYGWPYDGTDVDEEYDESYTALAGDAPGAISPDNELFALLPALAPGAGGISCHADLGPDLLLRVALSADGITYHAQFDMSGVLQGIAQWVSAMHARLHDAHDVAAAVEVGRQGQGRRHRRHHHHHRQQQQQQDPQEPQHPPEEGQVALSPNVTTTPAISDQIAQAAQQAATLAAAQVAAQFTAALTAANARRGHGGRAHGAPAAPAAPAAPDAAVQSMAAQGDAAATAAGEILIGALYDQHLNAVGVGVGGFWDSLKGAYRTISTPVTWLNKTIAKGLQKLEPAVTIAATAVATAYGGPAAGAAASRLTGPLLDSSAKTGGDPTMLFEHAKDEAHQQSGGDPQVAQAMEHATNAIAHTAAAYHLTSTASDAAAGDPDAARKISEIDQAASQGDPHAAQAMQLLAQAFATAMSNDAEKEATTTSGAEARSVAAAQSRALRAEGMAAAQALNEQHGSRVIGFAKLGGGGQTLGESGHVVTMSDLQIVQPFSSVDEADDWFGTLAPRDVLYAAYYDAGDVSWPYPLNETFGRRATASAPVASAGLLSWLALGAAGGGAYAWWRHHQEKKAAEAAAHAQAPTTSAGIGLLPYLAFAGAGAAGWYGRGWWQDRQAKIAAEAAAAAAAAASPAPPAGPAPVTSGWW